MLIILLLLFLIGLFIGSFLGVVSDRLPLNKTIVKGRSYCDFCKKTLNWYDLIPLLSFLILKGKCRYCKKKLPLFYPATELLTGVLFALVGFFFIPISVVTFVFYLFIISIFICIFFGDLKYGTISDKLIIAGTIVSFVFFLFFEKSVFLNHLISAVAAFIFFVAISYIFLFLTKKESMGGGDIKLSFLLGFFLGFPGIVVSLYIAFLTGAIVSIILILWKKKSFQKDSLPFGPFLIIGSLISFFLGNLIFWQTLRLLGIF